MSQTSSSDSNGHEHSRRRRTVSHLLPLSVPVPGRRGRPGATEPAEPRLPTLGTLLTRALPSTLQGGSSQELWLQFG